MTSRQNKKCINTTCKWPDQRYGSLHIALIFQSLKKKYKWLDLQLNTCRSRHLSEFTKSQIRSKTMTLNTCQNAPNRIQILKKNPERYTPNPVFWGTTPRPPGQEKLETLPHTPDGRAEGEREERPGFAIKISGYAYGCFDLEIYHSGLWVHR